MMKKNENGRSMVEMLGVLAIIGVLSIGGIAGYTLAMNRYRANEIMQVTSLCAVAAQSANGGEGLRAGDETNCLTLLSIDNVPTGLTSATASTGDDAGQVSLVLTAANAGAIGAIIDQMAGARRVSTSPDLPCAGAVDAAHACVLDVSQPAVTTTTVAGP